MQLNEECRSRVSSCSALPTSPTRTHIAEAVDVQHVRERDGDEEVLYEAVEQTRDACWDYSASPCRGRGQRNLLPGVHVDARRDEPDSEGTDETCSDWRKGSTEQDRPQRVTSFERMLDLDLHRT